MITLLATVLRRRMDDLGAGDFDAVAAEQLGELAVYLGELSRGVLDPPTRPAD